ncbi:MAG: 2-hydroxychromene-2-carboxylate isomerase [Pannonibacter sp.]
MTAQRPKLSFWFDFGSTYSYLTAMRIETVARDRGLDLAWRPFLLGPIFSRQGWSTSPFNLFPAKGRYMWREMERMTEEAGLPLVQPDPFPQNGLIAARIAHANRKADWAGAFIRAVFMAEFGEGRDISDPALIAALLLDLGADARAVMAAADSIEVKIGLRAAVAEAETLGIFGAPSFVTDDGELYWGNDRLEDAVEWALRIVT